MTVFFKEYIIYKPDINKIDEEIFVDKLINCKNNCFHTFRFELLSDVKFKGINDKEIINKGIRNKGLVKERKEMILAQEKRLGFIELDKLIIKLLG